jgi:hypothetical protein
MKLRRVDWGLILTVLTLAGVLWTAYAKPASWDQTVKDMMEIKPKVYDHDKQLAVVIEKLSSMEAHLESIDRKLGR